MSVYRTLDANLNRVREGLRVLEDCARFSLDDGDLSGRCKNLRARLADIEAKHLPGLAMLAGRDTAGDAGTALSNEREESRAGALDILRANIRRVQEGLRVLEETAKLVSAPAALVFKELRYGSYTLEQALVARELRARLNASRVMLVITGDVCRQRPEDVAKAAYTGGVRCFQVREKGSNDGETFKRVESIARTLLELPDALVIVNDRPDFALAAGAHGVHLGRSDMPIDKARALLGPMLLIGASTHSIDEVRSASGADYLGAGAMFASTTKQVQHLGGPDFGAVATKLANKQVFCVGGITVENARVLKDKGVARIAVSSAICSADNPEYVARELTELFDSALRTPHSAL
ncbi:MAG: thiamine phosphate synthase [Planctomycetaceae bacterium]|nr:thiamine phosphate synthase [Planctomycetaceae bacterium]